MKNIRYFSVDGEFSGLDHRKNSLLSIGIIEIKKDNGIFSLDYSSKFYLELKPSGEINEESMKINKLNLSSLEEFGVNSENAVREINKYLNLKSNDEAVFIAYCGVLDKIFIDQLYQDNYFKSSCFNYEIIEISSLAIGKLGLDWGFSEKELLTRLKLDDLIEEEKHNALCDSILQAKIFCNLLNN